MKQYLFDLDGTLTKIETIPFIAQRFGFDSEIERLTRATISGQISFEEGFSKRVEMLKKIPVSEVATLLENVPLHEKIIDFICENSEQCSIVTGNLDVWIGKLCARIGCEVYSSRAKVLENQIVEIESILQKDLVVKKFQSLKNFVVYIGDGANDFDAMKCADLSIAVEFLNRAPDVLKSVTNIFVDKEDDLIKILRTKKTPERSV